MPPLKPSSRDQRQRHILGRDAWAQAAGQRSPASPWASAEPGTASRARARPRVVPMPNASAPNAPCVLVWLSPQTIVMPGSVRPSSGPMTWTMPWRPLLKSKSGTPKAAALLRSASTCARASGSAIGRCRGRRSARCDRRWQTSDLAGARDGRSAAGLRTPAATSLRERGADRCRSGCGRRRARARRARPRLCRAAFVGPLDGMVRMPPVVERRSARLRWSDPFPVSTSRARRVRRGRRAGAGGEGVFNRVFDFASASLSICAVKRSSIAALAMAPIGFAQPLPAMSGAEPCTGS